MSNIRATARNTPFAGQGKRGVTFSFPTPLPDQIDCEAMGFDGERLEPVVPVDVLTVGAVRPVRLIS
jgi:hypothetical protein